METVNTVSTSGPGPAGGFPLGATVRLAQLDVDPYPILARLRSEEPVSWVPETRMWFVTPRREIVSILRDASRFTTEADIERAAETVADCDDMDSMVHPGRPGRRARVLPRWHVCRYKSHLGVPR